MKPIRFTQHALEKLSLVHEWGFTIDEEAIIEALQQPQEVLSGHLKRSIVHIILDELHILRVIYEEDGEITVITMYPGRRRRYEG